MCFAYILIHNCAQKKHAAAGERVEKETSPGTRGAICSPDVITFLRLGLLMNFQGLSEMLINLSRFKIFCKILGTSFLP